ncbi:unnamed protein product, partial [Musa hybrid cultivar]
GGPSCAGAEQDAVRCGCYEDRLGLAPSTPSMSPTAWLDSSPAIRSVPSSL